MIPRVAEDSPKIMVNVSEAFPKDDLEIEISDPHQEENKLRDYEITKEADKALDDQDTAIKDETIEVETSEVAKAKNTQWMKLIREEGFKAVVRVVFTKIFENSPVDAGDLLDRFRS